MKLVKKQSIPISIILIIILGFAVYGNSINGKFVWDDEFLVEKNAYIKVWSRISNIFTKNIAENVDKKSSFYRPLQLITYAIDYSIWRLNVRGYHLTNIILHILAALSIYWLINILYDNRILSLFTSMLFITHPVHTEAVSYISGRADPLSLIFMLISFILYIKHLSSSNKTAYILMLLSYILALLSRENSLILPVLLLLHHFSFKKRLKIKEFISILAIACIYMLLRITLLKSMLTSISINITLLQRIPGFFAAITSYIRLLFLPFNLHMEYGYVQFNITNPKVILGIAISLSLLTYAFSRRRNANNLIFFCILWFFITLLPQSNLYPINAYMAEHWLYIPSIGFFLIVANGLNSLYRRKGYSILTICLITGLVTFYSYLTIRQNSYWREPMAIYERTLKYVLNSPRIYNNLGNIYSNIGKKDQAIALYKKAIAIKPDYAEAYSNLGSLYHDIGKKGQAITSYKKAIEINPNLAKAYYNLGNIYRDIGKKEETIALYKKAIEIDPNLAKAYNNLAVMYYDMSKKERAITLFQKAIEINPNFAEAYHNLAATYKDFGKKEEVIALYKKAIELKPNYATAHFNLSTAYYDKKQYDLAVKHCDSAIKFGYKVDPEFLRLLEPYRKFK